MHDLNAGPGRAPPDHAALSAQQWLSRQYRVASAAIARSISATGLLHHRRAFGQTIVPKKGSVLASPVSGFYDPEPDYFFHWVRDSALVMSAVSVLIRDGDTTADWVRHFDDFLEFSSALNRLSGQDALTKQDFQKSVDPAFRKYLRPESELALVEGDRVLAEARYNPDGTLDIIKWSRPQYDGPALRALAVMRYWSLNIDHPERARSSMVEVLGRDLSLIARHWREPSYDLWEETLGHHYHTRIVQLAALQRGSAWAEEVGNDGGSHEYLAIADQMRRYLDALWSPTERIYRRSVEAGTGTITDALDIAVILGVIHAGLRDGRHSVLDDRVHSTLLQLEALFESEFPINRNREAGLGPAMGRYKGDRYYGGGAYYIASLAVAEFYYQLANAVRAGASISVTKHNRALLSALLGVERCASINQDLMEGEAAREAVVAALIGRGDMMMAMIRKYTPPTGELSEQFDKVTGKQMSARDLAWSYAAFITAVDARKQAMSSRWGIPQPPAASG